MDALFKDQIKLDNFLSDAQRECVERFGCWLRDKHFSRELSTAATSVRRSGCSVGQTPRE